MSKKKLKFIISAVATCSMVVYAYFSSDIISQNISQPVQNTTEVHFIDVGQADASLIISGDSVVLIDGGENNDEDFLVDYLQKQGVTNISLIVGTHPHEDHIGGIDAVIENFATEKVLMPNYPADTVTFDDVIKAMEDTKTPIESPMKDKVYNLSEGVNLTLISDPLQDFSGNTNDHSLVMRLDIGEDSVLFTGDIEKAAESHLIEINADVDVDILKVAHHGSETSSLPELVEKISPEISIISCGYDNSYGHPSAETIKTLESVDSEIFITYEEGSIVLNWDENGNFIDN